MTSIFRRKGRRGWTLKYRDGRGVDRMKVFRVREDAMKAALKLRTSPDPGDRRRLKEYAAVWLTSSKLHLRPASVRVYTWSMRKHVLPSLGETPLRDLARAQVRGLAEQLLAAGLKRRTVLNVIGVLEACLGAAVADGVLYVNVAADHQWRKVMARAEAARRGLEQTEALDSGQLRTLLETARREIPTYALRLRLMAMTGMRLGEVLGLQWSDLDMAGRTVRVARGVTATGVQPPKSGRARTVDVAQGLNDELTAWDAETKAIALRRGAQRSEWVFPARHRDGPGQHRETEQAFKKALAAAGLPPHHTPHSLRHTYASLQLQRGISPLYVQRQLGHASLKMTTEVYGRWLPLGDAAAADGLEAAVTRTSPARATAEPVS